MNKSPMKHVRFRQSYAKTLLIEECPALLRQQVEDDNKIGSRAMQAGSLIDALVFDQDDKYEIVDARYRSGEREGEVCTDWTSKDAREQRDAIAAQGLLPVLECELAAAMPTAEAISERIRKLAIERAGPDQEWFKQQEVEWTSALGVKCRGTPDIMIVEEIRPGVARCYTIDVKHTAFMQQKRFERQIYAMCWDVQGFAYGEASEQHARDLGYEDVRHVEHWIVATSSVHHGLPAVARQLTDPYMAVGKKRWERAQREWQELLDSDHWPGYAEAPAMPPRFAMLELESFEAAEFPEEEP